MKRIFAAIKIECHPSIDQLLSYLKTNLSKDKIKWVEAKNLHLTLKFFGETSDDKVQMIADALNEIKQSNNNEIVFSTTGIFGSKYDPKLIWLGIKENENLKKIVDQINITILPLGYAPNRQNFVPHLTLGRINFLNDKVYFQKIINNSKSFIIAPQKFNEFQLFESKLKLSGPEYSIIKTIYLAN